ncbi:MAG: chloride channel protein, partial [Muribaculaceae bacterium]|nr:chloride channel protein [Muribaculaceae bacterium]
SKLLAQDMSALTSYGLFAGVQAGVLPVSRLVGGLLLVKAFATASTTSGGGVAGDFAPSLFAGCVAGCFFAVLVNALFDTGLPVGYFGFFGMGAVMAATQRAPLMAIFLTVEMGAAYRLLLPVVIVSTVSYMVFRASGCRFGLCRSYREGPGYLRQKE